MSLEESDDLNIPDAAPVDPVLEAGALPKFDMHLYKSSLNETHVRYRGLFRKLVPLGVNRVIFFEMYCRSLDISPTVPLFHVFYKLCKQGNWFSFQNRTEKDCKPCLKDAPTSLKKWNDNFFLVDWRAAPIAMAWRHHDSNVADSLPRPSEYNASDVAKLREDSYFACTARVTHLAPIAGCLKDIPPNTGDMMVAEMPCRKVLDDKEKKKKKAEEKAAAKAPAANIQVDAAVNKGAGKEGPFKKRRVRAGPLVPPNSEHVSSPTPLNQAKPLESLADEEHASPPCRLVAWIPCETRRMSMPLPYGLTREVRETLMLPMPLRVIATTRVAYPDYRLLTSMTLHSLPFTPQWGLTDSSRMDNSRKCRDMMANLFTPADEEFFNEGVRDELAIRRSWKMLCQSAQQQANTLLRFEAIKEQPANLAYAHESCKDVKYRYKECRKELVVLQSVYNEKVSAFDQLFKNYDGALTREKGLQDRLEGLKEEKRESNQLNSLQANQIKQLEEALKQSKANTQQLRIEKERDVFSLAIGKGFMDGISIGREDADVRPILQATLNDDPASCDIFMDAYEKLFDQRYPYIDKVARMYILDPNGLQNIMLDETGPTHDEGPRDTPTTSYA
nr:hypothetical protein [Tanacetum cinerariifolium]